MELFLAKDYTPKLDSLIKVRVGTGNWGRLAIIKIGSNQASAKYVSLKTAYCDSMGIQVKVYEFDETPPKEEYLKIVNDPKNSSVIVQLPLPASCPNSYLDFIAPSKDVDFLSDLRREIFFAGDHSVLPPVVRAFELFLKQISPKKMTSAVVGEGYLVGKPIRSYLQNQGFEVTAFNETQDLSNYLFVQDVVVLATGSARFFLAKTLLMRLTLLILVLPERLTGHWRGI